MHCVEVRCRSENPAAVCLPGLGHERTNGLVLISRLLLSSVWPLTPGAVWTSPQTLVHGARYRGPKPVVPGAEVSQHQVAGTHCCSKCARQIPSGVLRHPALVLHARHEGSLMGQQVTANRQGGYGVAVDGVPKQYNLSTSGWPLPCLIWRLIAAACGACPLLNSLLPLWILLQYIAPARDAMLQLCRPHPHVTDWQLPEQTLSRHIVTPAEALHVI
mmetsp:Transcript_25958/g.56565  ORF Transcript_25958/g.56565 Transcript_25958/m.56565 type:complete len:217 (+) Transcript_25958:182-832(+)